MEPGSDEARKVLQRAQSIIDRLALAEQRKTEAQQAARGAFEEVRAGLIEEVLRGLTLDQIKLVTEGRIRLEPIQFAGYKTVQDVLGTSRFTLEALPGVGPSTATKVRAAANQLANQTRETVVVRIDTKRRSPSHQRLLEAVRRQEHIDQTLGQNASPFSERLKLIKLAEVAKAASEIWLFRRISQVFTRLFGGPDEVRNAEAALDQLSVKLVSSPVRDELALADKLGSMDFPRPVWDEFLSRPADFYAYLTRLGVQEADENAAAGKLPLQIVEAVRKQPLDESLLDVRLRGYQSFGAKYALAQKRSLLGDEMGLGKTIQALAALAHLAVKNLSGLLVVCPAAVVANWGREISAKSKLIPLAIQGSKAERSKSFANWIRRGGVGVVSFESARALHQEGHFNEVSLRLLVVDEAHYAKNPHSARSMAVEHLSRRAECVLFMSGTPLENRLSEFHSLIRYLQPEIAAACKQADRLPDSVVPHLLRELVAPVYLRRNQEDVLTELPEKIESDEWLDLGEPELNAYRVAVKKGDFMGMRQAVTIGSNGASAKLERLKEIVEEAGMDGQKVIVFSFFLAVIEAVSSQLKNVYGPIHGAVNPRERQNIIDSFSAAKGPAVLVAQIQSGGTGLNIQAASVVVLMEPQIKPSWESQAIARAHRMGQTRRVQVFRLLALNSVDERMIAILAKKVSIFDQSVRESAMKDEAPDAIDVSDTSLTRALAKTLSDAHLKQIVLSEQKRLSVSPTSPIAGDTA